MKDEKWEWKDGNEILKKNEEMIVVDGKEWEWKKQEKEIRRIEKKNE